MMQTLIALCKIYKDISIYLALKKQTNSLTIAHGTPQSEVQFPRQRQAQCPDQE